MKTNATAAADPLACDVVPPSVPHGSRGQILVIFAGGMLLFALLSALVIDLSWYWTNNLRMQRAADAAALAGVVFLPNNVGQAVTVARAEAGKNGFEHGVDGIVVTPVQDPSNDRRLLVTISGPVGTYFARVVGIDSWQAQRTAKADFVLPVPMGSPQNYYGVGEYQGTVRTVTDVPGNTAQDGSWNAPTTSSGGGQWLNPDRAFTNNDSYTTEDTNNHAQVWTNFNLQGEIPNDGTLVIDGLEVRLQDARLTGSGTSTSCRIQVAVSWNSGGSWSSNVPTAALTTGDTDPVVGSNADTSMWTPHTTWTRGDFANGTFRVRLTWQDGTASCAGTRNVQLDQVEVRVQYHTTTTTVTQEFLDVVAPDNVTVLNPQRFWGAAMTLGSARTYGDQHGPANDGGGANADHDPDGYDYSVEVGAGGEVWIFDAGFCETAGNGTGGWFGAGDHWIGSDRNAVTTRFRLYNTNGNYFDEGSHTLLPLDPSFPSLANQQLTDQSGNMGTPRSVPGAGDCSQAPHSTWHNKWVPLARGLGAGLYRVNVNLADAANNATNAENGWSIWVIGGAQPRVYGGGRMVAYNNLRAGQTDFYLAQIDAVHAGKTLEMQLFDPDASSNGTLSILSPNGGTYNLATFDYAADANCTGASDACSATGRQQIRVVNAGAQGFNNSVVTISIALPPTYGSAAGGGLAEDGWWKIRYNVDGGNDTTTWKVSIRGNPVHLVLP